jgi:dTDP-4-amino-4,6-dideoxygalactose transaminase
LKIPFLDLGAIHADMASELSEAWQQVITTGQFIGGEYVDRFEAEWAQYCGVKHCVGVSSGTSALELVLKALGIGADDEVIVPANTFIATASAVVAAGAQPVFIDVAPSTLLMTAAHVEEVISRRTAAVIVVHLYGQPADMDAIGRVARAAGIAVIEDAAQAHGSAWRGGRAGGLSDAGCFSFYPGKNLGALGDAGAVTTNDPALADRIRSLGNHGSPPGARHLHEPGARHLHEIIGTNARLDALQAAVLSVKLKHLDAWNANRRRAAAQYELALADFPVETVRTTEDACSNYHLVVIQTPHRDALRERMAAQDISTGIHYPIPCHLQRAFLRDRVRPLPVTERAASQILSLPMSPNIHDAQIRRVVEVIDHSLKGLERSSLGS